MRSAKIGAAVALTTLGLGTSTAYAHSLYEAKDTLYGLGYYDVHVERASLPYSFNACKRGSATTSTWTGMALLCR